jgi:hypothetical protein
MSRTAWPTTLRLVPILALVPIVPAHRVTWGEHGHRLIGQAAAAALPAAMPAFFRNSAPQLAYLNPEPDRWRERTERDRDPALDGATAPDHFIDWDMLPASSREGLLAARDRLAYADSLQRLGMRASTVGLLPFRILELEQRLRVEFRLWRGAPDGDTRSWIEARIINDAGILGHYVADGSNPAHTTLHFNGWVGENPHGYATDKRFHARFESIYVESHLTLADVQPLIDTTARRFADIRPAVIGYLRETNAEVERLYALDKEAPFDRDTTRPENKRFAAERLAAGARMLRDLWWSAYATSADDAR